MDNDEADRSMREFMQKIDEQEKREALEASFQTDPEGWEKLKKQLDWEPA